MEKCPSNLMEVSQGLLSPATPACIYREMLSNKQWKIIKSFNKDAVIAHKGLTRQILYDFLFENQVKSVRKHHSKEKLAQLAVNFVRCIVLKRSARESPSSTSSQLTSKSVTSNDQSVVTSTSRHVTPKSRQLSTSRDLCASLKGERSDQCSCVVDVEQLLDKLQRADISSAVITALKSRPGGHMIDTISTYLLMHGQQVNSSCRKDVLEQLENFVINQQHTFSVPSEHNITFRRKKAVKKPTAQTNVQSQILTPKLLTTPDKLHKSAPPKITNQTSGLSQVSVLTLDFNNLSPAITSTPNKKQNSVVKRVSFDNKTTLQDVNLVKSTNFPENSNNISSKKEVNKVNTKTFTKFNNNETEGLGEVGKAETKKVVVPKSEGYKNPTVSWLMKIKGKHVTKQPNSTKCTSGKLIKSADTACKCVMLNDCKFIACKHFIRCHICAKCHICHKKIL